MRFALSWMALAAASTVACGPGAMAQSNGAKADEALVFLAAAAAAQVVQSAAEAHARNNPPVTHASTGVGIAPQCDNDGQYSCVTVTPPSMGERAPTAPEPGMTDDEVRDYVLRYVNGVRKLNAAPPVVRDEAVDASAQAGSDALAQDRERSHLLVERARELQGSQEDSGGALQDRIAEILVRWMAEGAGGRHHEVLLQPAWRKIGIGLTSRDGRVDLTVDFL